MELENEELNEEEVAPNREKKVSIFTRFKEKVRSHPALQAIFVILGFIILLFTVIFFSMAGFVLIGSLMKVT